MQDETKAPAKGITISDIFFQAKELEARGIEVIHFDVGEPDFPPPREVVEATCNALKAGSSRYTGPGGILELREEIARHVNSRYGVKISPKQVLFTAGGRLALFLAFSSLPRGSKVGMISPDWPAYRDLCNFFSFRLEFFETSLKDSWSPNLESIEESDCNALVLNYPNNPTGKILSVNEYDDLIRVAERKKMKIVSDEVYSDYIFSDKKFKSILETGVSSERIFTTSMSKSYSMTGFRSGYLISDEATISKLSNVNSLVLTSAPEFVQYGAIAALRQNEFVREKVEMIKERRTVACRTLEELGLDFNVPDGALYLFPKLVSSNGTSVDSEKFALDLLREEHVSVTPGTVFGPSYSDYVRLTLLQDNARIAEGIRRMSKLLG